MMAAAAGITYVRIEKRFGLAEAARLGEALALLGPIRHVAIDFSTAEHVEDAALPVLAQILARVPRDGFRLHGLTHHKRRLLRYMGVSEQPVPVPAGS